MATAKQINANKLNAQYSSGPKTVVGKNTSAANALKHGLTAKKYLTSSESWEEFEALYIARRKLYPPDDPIIDSLIEKITLAHFRMDRGFEAEAETLRQGSLAEMLVNHNKPFKSLVSYEGSNRKTLKLLEEELARYLSMRAETGDLESVPTSPATHSPEAEGTAASHLAANDAGMPSLPSPQTPSTSTSRRAEPKAGKDSGPVVHKQPAARVTATSSMTETTTPPTQENQKTNPISNSGNGVLVDTTEKRRAADSLAMPASAPMVAATAAPIPAVSPPAVTQPPQPIIQTNFDIRWDDPPNRR